MDNVKQEFIGLFRDSISSGTFVKVTLGKYRGGDSEFRKTFVTVIDTKEGEKISFKFRYKTKDIVKNYDLDKGIKLLDEITGKDFLSATLFTTIKDHTLDYSKKRIPKLYSKKPTQTERDTSGHNKLKSRMADQHAKYFHLLGITTEDGKVKEGKYDKFRQVDKFIEIVDSLYRASGLKEKNEIRITDMGSGKSYLTFALYDYFSNAVKKNVLIKGIEQRDELVQNVNKIAEECNFEGLKFETGSIEDLNPDRTDIVVALHACDTATDDAILKASGADAEIIILAPCCHKYLRKKMSVPETAAGIYKHGILNERLAVSLTDGLRALMLEYFGYNTKVFEFISSEHTAKNTMITAVKSKSNEERSREKMSEIDQIKKEYHIDDFYLDKKMT